MTEFKINQIKTKEQINELINVSALTFEGMGTEEENLQEIIGWLEEHKATTDKDIEFHIIKGELMNTVFGLTGDNKYPNDLTIVSVTGINQSKIALPRFEVGGRWLDDIVDNNKRRER